MRAVSISKSDGESAKRRQVEDQRVRRVPGATITAWCGSWETDVHRAPEQTAFDMTADVAANYGRQDIVSLPDGTLVTFCVSNRSE